MPLRTLADVYADQLRDMHSAEAQLVKALPKMAGAASHEELRLAFNQHLEQTKEHLRLVDGMLADLGVKPGRKKCAAMEGLVQEGSEILEEDAEDSARDAGLIVAAQKVEHYEVASYGCLKAFASLLGHSKHVEALDTILNQEKDADARLTELATAAINVGAMA